MVSRVQTLRSSTTGARPPAGSREPGELYVNFVDKQIGLIDATKTPQDLIPIRYFSATANYAMRDLVMYDGRIYRATLAITAGAWNQAQWVPITSASIVSTGVALFEQTRDYKQNDVVVHDGKLYRANSAVAAGAWNGTNWTQISDYVLPAATAGALGGVKATAPVTGQFVTGINAGGDLTFAAATAGVVPFSATATYAANDLVSYQGKIYRANGVTAAGAWNAANWADIDTTLTDAIRAFDATKAYVLNDLVWNTGKVYSAKGPVPAGAFNAAQWNEIGAVTFPITAFDATKTYNTGDLVISSGRIYASKAGSAPGAWNAAQWTDLNGDAYLGNTQTFTKAQRGAPVAGTGTFDFATANNFTIAGAGAAVTIANPTNVVAGQSGAIVIDNAASVAFGTNFKFEGGTAATGSGAGKKDVLVYYTISATEIAAKLIKGV